MSEIEDRVAEVIRCGFALDATCDRIAVEAIRAYEAHKASTVPMVGKYVADYGPIPDLSGPTGAEELLASSRPSAVPEEIAEVVEWLREMASTCMIYNMETFRRAADLLERQWQWDRKRAEDIITLGGEVGRLEQENAALRKDLDTVWIATGTMRPSDFFRPPSSEP